MPYLLLVIGLIIGVYALYRFFLNANVRQIKAFFASALTAIFGIALIYLALTGKLIAALVGAVGLIPVVIKWFKAKKSTAIKTDTPMTRAEALDILGLKDPASEDDIKTAYKTLIKKLHPDQEGSEWMSAKLNQARDFLLTKKR